MKPKKKRKLRNAEYYDIQSVLDELYEKSKSDCKFVDLISIIASEENIKLAYRNIKKNKGSKTHGTDGETIADLEKWQTDTLIKHIRKKLAFYQPQAVRRVEIPKANGKTRPLGIPTIMDRLIQQCIYQVLEPIAEAKFHERNNGFRPNRSVEHAMAQVYKMIQTQHLYYVIDIDIKSFFDNVQHGKLLKQLWTLGIEDHMHDGKGIRVISSDKTISVFMKWPEVAERIADLIDDNNYFREGEKSQTNSDSEAAPATEENHTDVNEYGLAERIEEQKEENTDLDAIGLDQSELGGAKQRFKNNVEAIRLVKKLYREEKAPTESEKKTLAKYVGWGGLPQAFDENNESWQREYKELKALLSQDEYDTAKGSVLNAHFTSKEVITGIYAALQRFGVRGNNKVLEPAVGTGNFFGFMPKEISENARLYGVELDEITGKIATKLYPNANIQIKGFEQTTFSDNQFDIMVSNVPFGNYSVYDSAYARYSFQIHDYFIAKGIDKIKPGGIMAVITSKGTMDKQSASVRKYIADRAELIGAIRLPNTAFKQTAGTEVTSDILFFRKRNEKINATPENTEWLTVGKNEQGLELNSYYISHPERAI